MSTLMSTEAQGEEGTPQVSRALAESRQQLQGVVSGYGAQDIQPLVPYAALAGIFNLLFAGFLLAAKQSKRPLPERLAPRDILLLGVATHKLSRLISRDQVTAFLRAPFVTFKSPAAASEVEEEPRGTGWQRALGNLITCPYCVAQWVAAGFVYGLVFAPRTTRLVAGAFAAYTLADFLGLAYEVATKIAFSPVQGQQQQQQEQK